MSLALIVLVIGTLIAAVIDVRSHRIPNGLTATMALAAIGFHAGGTVALLTVLAAMAGPFLLGTLAFSVGWFGGGDVKLVSAACGLVSYPGCVSLLLFILIAGAVLALVQAARRRRLGTLVRTAYFITRTGSAPPTRTLLPYGVAIAGGSAVYALSAWIPALRLPV